MRCSACNSILEESEILWREDRHEWEDLCLQCRKTIYDPDMDSDLLFDEEYLALEEFDDE